MAWAICCGVKSAFMYAELHAIKTIASRRTMRRAVSLMGIASRGTKRGDSLLNHNHSTFVRVPVRFKIVAEPTTFGAMAIHLAGRASDAVAAHEVADQFL